jgi:magnesium transporter
MNQAQSDLPVAEAPSRLGAIAVELVSLAPNQAAEKLDPLPDAEAATVLAMLSPAVAEDIMLAMGDERRQAVIAAAPLADSSQWTANFSYPDGSIGRLMEPPRALFRPEMTVAESTERIRELVKNVFVTYGFVVDARDQRPGRVDGRGGERGASLHTAAAQPALPPSLAADQPR